jgi:hypothetical protein
MNQVQGSKPHGVTGYRSCLPGKNASNFESSSGDYETKITSDLETIVSSLEAFPKQAQ